MEFAEMIVCILAVFGVYAILCRLLALFCRGEKLSYALHIANDKEAEVLADDGVREAILLTESENGRLMPPVILLDEALEDATLARLRDYGYRIYRRED